MEKLSISSTEVFKLRLAFPAKLTCCPQSTLGDFNNDGQIDIALSMMDMDALTSDLTILLANENRFTDGTYILQNPDPTYQTSNILSADLNSDGYTDLIVGRSGGDGDTLANNGIAGDMQLIYVSNANGKFEKWESSQTPYIHNVMIDDLNGDGDIDAFFFATEIGPSVLASNNLSSLGNIEFTTRGLPDKAINSSTAGSWDVLEHYPNGALKTMRAWHHHNTAFNDVDRDGDLDMVLFFAGSSEGLIYLNNGKAEFNQRSPLTYDATIPGIPAAGNFMYGLLNPDGSWKGLRVVKQGANFYETVQFDVNGDGWKDVIAVATLENHDYVHIDTDGRQVYQNGTDRFNHGTFYSALINSGTGLSNESGNRINQPQVSTQNTQGHYGHFTMLSLVDLNGDGHLDFMSSQNNSQPYGLPNWMNESDTVFMLNDGNGKFRQVEIEGLKYGNFHALPIQGKLGFTALTVPTDKDWLISGLPPRPYAEFTFLKTTIPWTVGGQANDFVYGTVANDLIDGGGGIDTFYVNGRQSDYLISKSSNWMIADRSGLYGKDSLFQVERVRFDDRTLALDIHSSAGQAYRIYKAAFNRTPDTGGLGYWIAQMDRGMDVISVAARFIDSPEFRSLYGQNPTNAEFLTKVYSNVLARSPDAAGLDWWVNEMKTNPSKTWQKVLADFSESTENQANVASLIANGIEYVPWTG
jgi:hypothetical protein